MLVLYLCLCGLLLTTFIFYVHVFVLIQTKPPEHSYFSWMYYLANRPGFFKRMITFGFFKSSLRRYLASWRVTIFPQPIATPGKSAPDAELVSLEGQCCSLLQDYILKTPAGMPLILNMGSYT